MPAAVYLVLPFTRTHTHTHTFRAGISFKCRKLSPARELGHRPRSGGSNNVEYSNLEGQKESLARSLALRFRTSCPSTTKRAPLDQVMRKKLTPREKARLAQPPACSRAQHKHTKNFPLAPPLPSFSHLFLNMSSSRSSARILSHRSGLLSSLHFSSSRALDIKAKQAARTHCVSSLT